ncbi:hypothetical protein [Cupriavidus metallidurans]|uniref:hypothetical protein n=1 Tax=Cupriavidus metallidurans TaxID=119219 RepID=UPI001CCBE915|nr:hypothetical protein [Cupriavidus metallidurans]UBM12686.1 hypothetical protein LAI70_28140 [Cupriavidus metallidurans]
MISGRLGDFSFASSWITDWLQKNGKPAPTSQQIQQWRHRWLIALAKEWDEGVRE